MGGISYLWALGPRYLKNTVISYTLNRIPLEHKFPALEGLDDVRIAGQSPGFQVRNLKRVANAQPSDTGLCL